MKNAIVQPTSGSWKNVANEDEEESDEKVEVNTEIAVDE